MELSEHRAGTARSGRDLKCPQCEANNRADAQWCWQCLERFPENASGTAESPATGEGPAEAPGGSWAHSGSVRRDARDEFTGIIPDEDLGARFATVVEDDIAEIPARGDANRTRRQAVGDAEREARLGYRQAVIEGEKGTIEVKRSGITWTCSRCDSVNGFERNVCEICGASFAEVLKEAGDEPPPRDPNTVALVSLFFPGAGHAYLGMWGQAIARGVISTWVVATSIFAAAQGATQSMIIAAVFAVVSFGLWAVSAHDAYREARNQKASVLLRDKLFLYVVLGLLLLSVMMVFSLAMGARGP